MTAAAAVAAHTMPHDQRSGSSECRYIMRYRCYLASSLLLLPPAAADTATAINTSVS
jgi:hypothetical protein